MAALRHPNVVRAPASNLHPDWLRCMLAHADCCLMTLSEREKKALLLVSAVPSVLLLDQAQSAGSGRCGSWGCADLGSSVQYALLELAHAGCPAQVLFLGACPEPPCMVTAFCARGSLLDVLARARASPVRLPVSALGFAALR